MSNDEGFCKFVEALGYGEKKADMSATRVGLNMYREYIEDMSAKEETTNFSTGAVRSADANHLDFTSLPLIGLIGVARTAAEGASKYNRHNYMLGMSVHDLLNHVYRHITLYTLGDRSEPHLEHAAWGLMAAIQQQTLDPELSKPHMLGPGATITDEVRKNLDDSRESLAARRKAGEFDGIGDWKLKDLPEIKRLLEQRYQWQNTPRAK